MSSVANTFVYELPEKMSDGFCFGGGRPITFLNVDWFHVPESLNVDELTDWLRHKTYCQPGRRYLVVGHHTFTFKKEKASA